jgi:hypothetical protein
MSEKIGGYNVCRYLGAFLALVFFLPTLTHLFQRFVNHKQASGVSLEIPNLLYCLDVIRLIL